MLKFFNYHKTLGLSQNPSKPRHSREELGEAYRKSISERPHEKASIDFAFQMLSRQLLQVDSSNITGEDWGEDTLEKIFDKGDALSQVYEGLKEIQHLNPVGLGEPIPSLDGTYRLNLHGACQIIAKNKEDIESFREQCAVTIDSLSGDDAGKRRIDQHTLTRLMRIGFIEGADYLGRIFIALGEVSTEKEESRDFPVTIDRNPFDNDLEKVFKALEKETGNGITSCELRKKGGDIYTIRPHTDSGTPLQSVTSNAPSFATVRKELDKMIDDHTHCTVMKIEGPEWRENLLEKIAMEYERDSISRASGKSLVEFRHQRTESALTGESYEPSMNSRTQFQTATKQEYSERARQKALNTGRGG